ncbi:MAG: Mur ligase family protein [Candidatus Caenarcaniphilales bacterium]|nr:Mur ligase family protein [Candidatus Caenarcaniphilales bacterium]
MPFRSLHFIGVGGAGMNPLAQIANELGLKVTGSDKDLLTETIRAGFVCWSPHDTSCWENQSYELPERVVLSTAITADNCELVYLKNRQVDVMHRSDLLQTFADLFPCQIVISGTHGKTTTTALTAWILESCDYPVTWVLGGQLAQSKRAYGWSPQAKAFLLEGDESDQSFLKPKADFSLVTALEPDHLENYEGSFEVQITKFQEFLSKSHFGIICLDCPNARQYLAPLAQMTYSSIYPEADWYLDQNQNVYFRGEPCGMLEIPKASGRHNALNALAAIALASKLGLETARAIKSLQNFPGVYRRFEEIGRSHEHIRLIDDYAHHPSEIKAAIECARSLLSPEGRLLVAFQPHLPTRLRDLWEEFKDSFQGAHRVWISDLYIARGKEISGINSARLVEEINQKHSADKVVYVAGKPENLIEPLLAFVKPNDLILILGAGDITRIRETLFGKISSVTIKS